LSKKTIEGNQSATPKVDLPAAMNSRNNRSRSELAVTQGGEAKNG